MTRLSLTLKTLLACLCMYSVCTARTFVVNTTADTHDAWPGDGICADAGGYCSLRAGVEEAGTGKQDTILFSGAEGPVFLRLGAVVVKGPLTVIAGTDSAAVIDGRYNQVGADNLQISADSCRIYRCSVINARRSGVQVTGDYCHFGEIGKRTIFTGNGLGDSLAAGILISKPSVGCTVTSVWVGLKGNGTIVDANVNGIRLVGTSGVAIDGSSAAATLIGGNIGHGIWIDSGSTDTKITGVSIGLNVTGLFAAPNGGDGILLSNGSSANRIGGPEPDDRNFISGNIGNGIRIEGPATRLNVVGGNVVGLDSSGWLAVGNQAAGIRICAGASDNTLGYDSAGAGSHLVVSGNYGNGIEIVGAGTDSNRIDWSWVGLDGTGSGDRPNGTGIGQGVYIGSGASHNVVGRDGGSVRNVISGNYGPGICIAGLGTNGNVIAGNYIGASRFGNSPEGNSAGVVIRDSAQYNEVGSASTGNLVSGNREDLFPLGAGVVLYGQTTSNNVVRNNFIGTDYTGTRTVRNGSAGIIIGGGASHNLIGGDTTVGNLISGNGTLPLSESIGAGIHIFGPGTDSNVIAGNLIGLAIDGRTALANNGNGIGIYGGARYTLIGGDVEAERNIISRNKMAGVWIDGPVTQGHEIRLSPVFDNDSSGISFHDGGNSGAPQVHILTANSTMVSGSCTIAGTEIDVYTAKANTAGRIQGAVYLGSTTADEDGNFSCAVSGLMSGDSVTAVGTAVGVGSSTFASSAPVGVPTAIGENDNVLPAQVTLYQNVPNPFNPTTTISFDLPKTMEIRLDVINILGERVATIVAGVRPAGHYEIEWDGKSLAGHTMASGAYFYRLSAGGTSLTRKMLLLK